MKSLLRKLADHKDIKAIGVFLLLTLGPVCWLFISQREEFPLFSLCYLSVGVLFNTCAEIVFLILIRRYLVGWSGFLKLGLILLLIVNMRYYSLTYVGFDHVQKLVFLSLFALYSIVAILSEMGFRSAVIFFCVLIVLPFFSVRSLASHSEMNGPVRFVAANKPLRNVYILGFDALAADDVYQRDFGAPPQWDSVLSHLHFDDLKRAVSPGSATYESYMSLLSERELSLDEAVHLTVASRMPAYVDAAANGYKVQFMFYEDYFGKNGGEYLDYFYNGDGLGLCPLVSSNFGMHLCGATKRLIEGDGLVRDEIWSYESKLESVISKNVASRKGYILIAYTWHPGHTPLDYRYYDIDARNSYARLTGVSSEETAAFMKKLVGFIQAQDKDAIIVIYGDHGPWLSRGWETDAEVRGQLTSQQAWDDRRRVGLFVYPENFCKERIGDGYRIAHIVPDILSCFQPGTFH